MKQLCFEKALGQEALNQEVSRGGKDVVERYPSIIITGTLSKLLSKSILQYL